MSEAKERLVLIADFSKHCHAAKDGECNWGKCPQNRDGEPNKTGRHCPIDFSDVLEGA